jgi:hypothetical protein
VAQYRTRSENCLSEKLNRMAIKGGYCSIKGSEFSATRVATEECLTHCFDPFDALSPGANS